MLAWCLLSSKSFKMLHWPWNLDEIILSTESKITLVSVIGWALSVTEEGTKIKIEQEFERCRFSVLIRVTNYHSNTDSYWEHMRKIKQCLDSQIILFVMIMITTTWCICYVYEILFLNLCWKDIFYVIQTFRSKHACAIYSTKDKNMTLLFVLIIPINNRVTR